MSTNMIYFQRKKDDVHSNDLFPGMTWSDSAAVYEGGLMEALLNDLT